MMLMQFDNLKLDKTPRHSQLLSTVYPDRSGVYLQCRVVYTASTLQP